MVLLSLALQIPQVAGLATAAAVSASSALAAQTFVAGADLAVQAFLLIGISASSRQADDAHPVGYGSERYFWSLFAALAILVSGIAVAVVEVLQDLFHPSPVASFPVAYLAIGFSLVLDGAESWVALRETNRRARVQHRSVTEDLRNTTEPATETELIGNGISFSGGVVALAALALAEMTGSTLPDTVATILIGLALMAGALLLIRQNRSLLIGQGVPPQELERMRRILAACFGVVGVPALFAVVVGPSALIVNGGVSLNATMTVPDVEAALERAARALQERWPEIRYVYLTPVADPAIGSDDGLASATARIRPPARDPRPRDPRPKSVSRASRTTRLG